MIHPELVQTPQWLCWTEEKRGDKLTKVPKAPWDHGDRPVSATDPDNWTDFETVRDWVSKTPTYEAGFAFNEDGPYVGVDLDDCVEGGVIADWAWEIIKDLDSFTEFSPSGTGIHVLCKGELDKGLKNDDKGVEIYDRERFFTVTGDTLDGYQQAPQKRQDAIDDLMDEYMIEADEPPEQADVQITPGDMPTGGDHPLYELAAADVYPTIDAGENTDHPVHGSTTGANFKIHDSNPTAVCWRGKHHYGGKNCCVLCAWHLLALENKNVSTQHCDEIRRRYPTDDKLVFAAWAEAYKRNLVDGKNPPYRAVKHAVENLGLEGMDDGGRESWALYRTGCRIIRQETGIPVEIDDDRSVVEDESSGVTIGVGGGDSE